MINAHYLNYRMLASQILLQAVEDYHHGHKDDVCQFANTEWFNILAEISDIDPINARTALTSGKLQTASLQRGKVCLY
jgi:hypothetical protein